MVREEARDTHTFHVCFLFYSKKVLITIKREKTEKENVAEISEENNEEKLRDLLSLSYCSH